ncbi:MAG: hypothetical protein WCG19_01095 [Chlorobiaceae bacterium]
MNYNLKYYYALFLLLFWHLYILLCYASPSVSDMYYQYYINGSIQKWNRGVGSKYLFGDLIDFRKGGNSSLYVLGGFSGQEKKGTWTCSEYIYIYLRPNTETKYDINLYMSAVPFLNEKHQNQYIEVIVNEVIVKKINYTLGEIGQNIQVIRVNNDIINSNKGNIVVKIRAKGLVSPWELGLSDDTRKLGVYVESIMLKEVEK